MKPIAVISLSDWSHHHDWAYTFFDTITEIRKKHSYYKGKLEFEYSFDQIRLNIIDNDIPQQVYNEIVNAFKASEKNLMKEG